METMPDYDGGARLKSGPRDQPGSGRTRPDFEHAARCNIYHFMRVQMFGLHTSPVVSAAGHVLACALASAGADQAARSPERPRSLFEHKCFVFVQNR